LKEFNEENSIPNFRPSHGSARIRACLRSSRESSAPISNATISASRHAKSPGVSFPKHTHPGEEIIYVLEGSLEYQVEGKEPVTLKAGDVLFISAGKIHAAKNVGNGDGSELATYVVEKGKPLVVLVK